MEASADSAHVREPPPSDAGVTEEAALATLTVLILSDLSPEALTNYAVPLLGSLGIAAEAVELAVALAGVAALPMLKPSGQATAQVGRTAAARRAAYLLNSARRLDTIYSESTAPAAEIIDLAERRERRYLAQHLAAERARGDAAARVDEAAKRHGPLLGWYAVLDQRTTTECRRAYRSNFRVTQEPAIGWPGTLHGGACRCRPGAPWPGGGLLD